ncbi:VOC family protein [Streptomyces sp. NPDC050997]|uniref:VOC family protein n=1 Tax=Streptomyces sp. NPDC050997 TaxID=3155519 RepID=UPI00341D536B
MRWLAGLPRRRARDRHRLAPAPGPAAGPGWGRRPLRRRRRSRFQGGPSGRRRCSSTCTEGTTCALLLASGFPRGGSTPSTTRPPPHTGRGLTRVLRAPRNRVHLDLLTADSEAEIRRLTALGATVQARHTDNVVLTDPEDNGFCLSATDLGSRWI